MLGSSDASFSPPRRRPEADCLRPVADPTAIIADVLAKHGVGQRRRAASPRLGRQPASVQWAPPPSVLLSPGPAPTAALLSAAPVSVASTAQQPLPLPAPDPLQQFSSAPPSAPLSAPPSAPPMPPSLPPDAPILARSGRVSGVGRAPPPRQPPPVDDSPLWEQAPAPAPAAAAVTQRPQRHHGVTPAAAGGDASLRSELGELVALQKQLLPLLQQTAMRGADAAAAPPAAQARADPPPPPYFHVLPKPRPISPPPPDPHSRPARPHHPATPPAGRQRSFDPTTLSLRAAEPVWRYQSPRPQPRQLLHASPLSTRSVPGHQLPNSEPPDEHYQPPSTAPAPAPATLPVAAPAAPPPGQQTDEAAAEASKEAQLKAAARTQPWRRHPAHTLLLELAAVHGVATDKEPRRVLQWMADEELLSALGRVSSGVWCTRYGLQGGPVKRFFSLIRFADNYKRMSPWLVWRDDDLTRAMKGRCPLSELVALTAASADTRAFRRYQSTAPGCEQKLDGPPRSTADNTQPRLLDVHQCLTLYFRQRPLSIHCGKHLEDLYRVCRAVVEINEAFGPQTAEQGGQVTYDATLQEGLDQDSPLRARQPATQRQPGGSL